MSFAQFERVDRVDKEMPSTKEKIERPRIAVRQELIYRSRQVWLKTAPDVFVEPRRIQCKNGRVPKCVLNRKKGRDKK
jgi:hypothetical protein